ncbi:MAG: hypothetical protein WBG30_03820 [Psychrilyobacter sp.]
MGKRLYMERVVPVMGRSKQGQNNRSITIKIIEVEILKSFIIPPDGERLENNVN